MKKAVMLLACVCALSTAATTAVAEQAPSRADTSLSNSTTGGTSPQAKAASARVQRAYRRWRRKLRRYGVWHGRNLVRAARSQERDPTARELRRSIRRMKRRYVRYMKTPRGIAVKYRFKVRRIPGWGRNHLRSIAWCESRNNPRAIGGGGAYRGMYQFSFSTWRVVGGSGDPAAAPRTEQTWRAWLLLKNHGAGHWPVCG